MFRKYLALLLLFALVLAQDGFEEGDDASEGDDGDAFEEDGEDAAADDAEDAEEAAEGAEEDDEEEEEEGAVEAVAAEAETAEEKSLAEQKEEEDLWILLIGISACLDVVWWFVWGWFVYIPTNTADSTMFVNSDGTNSMIPLAWFWQSLSHTTLSWTALNYLFIFLFYMLISIPELVFWIMVMIGEKTENNLNEWLFNMWASFVGLYGGWVMYFFNVLWPIVQMGTLGNIERAGYTNATVLMVMFAISWLYTGIVHTLGVSHINRKYRREYCHEPGEIPTGPCKTEPAPVEKTETPEPEEEEEEEEEVEEETDQPADSAFVRSGNDW